MKKIAFLFPGQGAQEVGMGRDLFGVDDWADELVEAASDFAGEDLKKLCLKGPDRRLAQTRYLQPALATVCLSLLKRLNDSGVRPDMVAGHSVGELPACVASKALDATECVRLAAARGAAMGDAATANPGGMLAVTGPEALDLLNAVDLMGEAVTVATVNAPTQVTLSGALEHLDTFSTSLKERVGAKVVKLRVEGAWHSRHMEDALSPFAVALDETRFNEPSILMVFNRDASTSSAPDHIRELLAGQLTRPVRWDKVMEFFHQAGVTDYVEIGPGKVLRGLVRLNISDPSIRVYNVANIRSLERTVAELTS